MNKLAGIILLGLALGAGAGETKLATETVLVRMMCECGGEMKPTGVCLTSNPPQYPHVCNKCGTNVTYYVTYPEIRYVTESEYWFDNDEGDPITGVVPDYPRLSPAVTNLWPMITWTNDNGTVTPATNIGYDVMVEGGMSATISTSITYYAVLNFDEFVAGKVTNVPPAHVKALVKRWAAQGKICEVLGYHSWHKDGEMYGIDGTFTVGYSGRAMRRCAICGKVETFKPGEWE